MAPQPRPVVFFVEVLNHDLKVLLIFSDKKGLLKDNGESGTDDTLKRPNNGHKEYEYNKTTGIITGKHSSV